MDSGLTEKQCRVDHSRTVFNSRLMPVSFIPMYNYVQVFAPWLHGELG